MANKKFFVGMLVMVLVFGMAVIGCDNGTTNGNGGDNGTTDPTVTLNPSTVTINDDNLSQIVSVGGTATGQVSINTTALPAGVSATLEGTTITVTGVRPTTDVPPVTGSPVIVVTREGVSQNLTVNINLTTTWSTPTPGSVQTYNFSETRFNVITTATSEALTFEWLTIGSGVNRNTANAPPFSHFIATGGAASGTQRYFRLQVAGPAEITIWAISNNANPTSVNISAPTSIAAIPLPGWQAGAAGMQPETFRSETAGSHTVTLMAAASSRFFQIRVAHD